jgi:hypothetical protein
MNGKEEPAAIAIDIVKMSVNDTAADITGLIP